MGKGALAAVRHMDPSHIGVTRGPVATVVVEGDGTQIATGCGQKSRGGLASTNMESLVMG